MIEGLNHVGISVVDLERSVAFYRDLLGMEVLLRKPFEGRVHENIIGLPGTRGKVAILRLGSWQLELFEFECPSPKPSHPKHATGNAHGAVALAKRAVPDRRCLAFLHETRVES
jgi:catechol 2,3-dioxygenase-like lactoylglutathione lyase family enzyme